MLTAHTFHNLIGKSPLPSLQQHMALAVESTEQLPLLLSAALKPGWGEVKALAFKVNDLARQAELVHAELVRDWPKGALIPIRRRDLIFALESQEQILDTSRQVASLLQLDLEIPPEVKKLMFSLVERDVKICAKVLQVTDSLDVAIRSGLTGPDMARIYSLVDEVRHSNDVARTIVDDLRATLHEQCQMGDSVSLVFALELARLLGDLSRHAERTARRATLLVSR